MADKTGKGHSGGGQALIRSRSASRDGAGGGRRIVHRPAECGSRLWGQAAPGAWGSAGAWAQVGVAPGGGLPFGGGEYPPFGPAFFGAPVDGGGGGGGGSSSG